MKDNFVVLIIMILLIIVIGVMLMIIPNKTESTNKITVVYQPMQCNTEPWGDLDSNIEAYFVEKNIRISNFEKIDRSEMVCQACDICPKSYYYTMKVYAKDLSSLKEIGFEQV